MSSTLVVVCGLEAEAKIARGAGIVVIAAGGDQDRLRADLERAAPDAHALLSFGVAGGLAPDLRAGDLRVANAIVLPSGERIATHLAWTQVIARRLSVAVAPMAGVDRPVAGIREKAALRNLSGADTVDMESHIVAQVATVHNLPLAAIRVVTDAADRQLPHAATVGMRNDGRLDLAAILLSIGKKPGQLPALIQTGLDARAAFAALLRCRQLLGPGFALVDFV